MGDIFGARSTRRAAEAQEEASALTRQRDNLSAARDRREAVRAGRIARARAVNAAANQGVSNSSAAQGGIGSIQSQLSSNVSFLDNFNLISDQASAKLGEMRKHEAKAAAAKARTSLVLKGGLFALGL